MRSRVVLDELCKRHDVQVVVSGRAYDYLKQRASEHLAVKKIWGYSIVYEDNEVQNFKTLLANVKGAAKGWPENVRAYFDLAEKFQPDVVISDFESWSYLFGARPPAADRVASTTCRSSTAARTRRRSSTGTRPSSSSPRRSSRPRSPAATTTSSRRSSTRRCASRTRRSTRRSCARRSWRRGPSPGEHLLVYQTADVNAALPEILARAGSSAASTGCAATSRRTLARATSATARSARPASSTTCAPRAA